MPLTLGLHIGDDFFVGDTRVKLASIEDDLAFTLEVVNEHGVAVKKVEVTDSEASELLPEVMVSAGLHRATEPGIARVVIEAPFRIRIFRGQLYRKGAYAHSKIHDKRA